jgi:hypothetical protein
MKKYIGCKIFLYSEISTLFEKWVETIDISIGSHWCVEYSILWDLIFNGGGTELLIPYRQTNSNSKQ